jgi:hypothetical protein
MATKTTKAKLETKKTTERECPPTLPRSRKAKPAGAAKPVEALVEATPAAEPKAAAKPASRVSKKAALQAQMASARAKAEAQPAETVRVFPHGLSEVDAKAILAGAPLGVSLEQAIALQAKRTMAAEGKTMRAKVTSTAAAIDKALEDLATTGKATLPTIDKAELKSDTKSGLIANGKILAGEKSLLSATDDTKAGLARRLILAGETNAAVLEALKAGFPEGDWVKHSYYPSWYRAQLVMARVITPEWAKAHSKAAKAAKAAKNA